MPNRLIIGQEAVVPGYGLGRIISFTPTYIEVTPYISSVPLKFDPCNVKIVPLTTVNFTDFVEQK